MIPLGSASQSPMWIMLAYFVIIPMSVMITVSKMFLGISLEEIHKHVIAIAAALISVIGLLILFTIGPFVFDSITWDDIFIYYLVGGNRFGILFALYFITTGAMIIGPLFHKRFLKKQQEDDAPFP